jgi:hypothetical protein
VITRHRRHASAEIASEGTPFEVRTIILSPLTDIGPERHSLHRSNPCSAKRDSGVRSHTLGG